MDGYRWERLTLDDGEWVQVVDMWDADPQVPEGIVAVPVARFPEFVAWVQTIAQQLREGDA